jgi:hypothetical protein
VIEETILSKQADSCVQLFNFLSVDGTVLTETLNYILDIDGVRLTFSTPNLGNCVTVEESGSEHKDNKKFQRKSKGG